MATEVLDRNKFTELCKMKYKDQAIWFLNGFWEEVKGDGEKFWTWVNKFSELDLLGPDRKGENGNELDQFWSAKFLEDMDKAITSQERKEALRMIDQDNNGKMALIEYLLWKYKKSLGEVANASQGENKEEIEAAQARIAEVQAALEDVLSKLEAQKQALAAQQQAVKELEIAVAAATEADEAAKRALQDCQAARNANAAKLAEQKIAVQESTSALMKAKAATEALRRAEEEQQKAVDELKKEEEAYAAKCKALEDTIANTTGMKNAKAKNELAQLKQEDPLPLRRAKITAEAAVRKVQKQRKVAEAAERDAAAKKAALEQVEAELEATAAQLAAKEQELTAAKEAAAQKKRELEAAQEEARAKEAELAVAVQELEAAYTELNVKMEEAQTALAEIKSKPGVAWGAIWWMQRELFEVDSRLPTSKMKFDHSKPFEFKEEQ